ncbi:Ribosomal protein S18 acetylase RimI [Halorubrum ezzemoulense]|uniref:Ribosomal protein S18 acetylase RimI n=1 Tax=Halorubrum ezzemoulense TaxID=337243 RepID=A0A238WMA7_HALEZ|nr:MULTISPECIES: GNAT family N-acetyltransferase [Halorubrum]MDB2224261.1 GNAT family N-acetyltransferase [Halorubrum ezzemoulense]MDB9251612.1 GNAT family N-acetyltransferase [Halorubrum ezzemoulense]MDB9256021.1 GNAT family N-acetyltransferase [Halorubrum ezzemoulense]MDB9276732.1 GNAT family N-acetyltransferase [Halorubrum ezzemoulense]TKX40786.1 N-acetyltransferase [Halorubrum sp. CGM4_25_10-8A]
MSEAADDADEADAAPTVVVREARPADADAVAAFTRDTWGERHEDYIPRVFPEWAASDDPDRGTFVATLPPDAADVGDLDGRDAGDTHVTGDGDGAADAGDPEAVVGCIQGALLSEWEAWGQGIRVDPAARGHGVGTALSEAVLDWARGRGATVCRNMVFSWNVMGLGQSRAVGFDPATEFRFAEPAPDPDAIDRDAAGLDRLPDPDPNAAWAFWSDSAARDRLRGLALDPDESWACSRLTRDELATAAAEDRLLAVADADALAGFAVRTRVTEREVDGEPTRTAVYGVAAWRDVGAAGALYDAIAADAAAADADRARVLIPETVEHVSDTGANRVPVAAEPDFVMCADLTGGDG